MFILISFPPLSPFLLPSLPSSSPLSLFLSPFLLPLLPSSSSSLSLSLLRTAMEKMRGIYEKNPQLGDAQQVAQQLVETQDRIELTAREIEEFKVQ